MITDIVAQLSLDPGQRTFGQLMQDREAAAHEIRRLRHEVERLSATRGSHLAAVDAGHTPTAGNPSPALIRLAELSKLLGVARSTIYKWMTEGSFPRPVRVSERAVRWRPEDIEEWRTRLPFKS